jgi:hypothetical protein
MTDTVVVLPFVPVTLTRGTLFADPDIIMYSCALLFLLYFLKILLSYPFRY